MPCTIHSKTWLTEVHEAPHRQRGTPPVPSMCIGGHQPTGLFLHPEISSNRHLCHRGTCAVHHQAEGGGARRTASMLACAAVHVRDQALRRTVSAFPNMMDCSPQTCIVHWPQIPAAQTRKETTGSSQTLNRMIQCSCRRRSAPPLPLWSLNFQGRRVQRRLSVISAQMRSTGPF